MTDTATELVITQPGIYTIPEHLYHRDPVPGGSLSSTGARRILHCPAKYRYERDNGETFKNEFDFGHAAHSEVLGIGAPVDVIDFDDWRTKDARAAKAEAHLEGRTPILAKDWEIVLQMAAQIRAHPLAARLLDPAQGRPEQSLFWRDQQLGIWRRARLDWLPERTGRKRLVTPDYKTARDAEARAFARAAVDHGYHQQADWYCDGIRALWHPDPAFVFIVQEKTAPYVVNVIELDETAMAIGAERNRRAISRFVECTTTDTWPGYSTEVELASLPKWAEYQHQEEYGNEQF